MSYDLVAELRVAAADNSLGIGAAWNLLGAAADEIDRLNADYGIAVTFLGERRKAFEIEFDRAAKAEAALAEVHAVFDREIEGAKQTLALDLSPAARASADGWLNAAKGIQIAVNKVWPRNVPAIET